MPERDTAMKRSRPSPYQKIWQAVGKVPRGRVATYGQIALMAGFPAHARLVGYALHRLVPGLPVPWQRVINARGTISFPRSSAQYRRQRDLLTREGVLFEGERIDLDKFGYRDEGKRAGPGRIRAGRTRRERTEKRRGVR